MSGVKRPLSPHLQVYRPQITSVLSIVHRLTGVFLALGTPLLVYWLFAVGGSSAAFDSAQSFMGSWFGLLLLLGWSFALFYHLCNGVRHLFWDMGLGFDLKTLTVTGWTVVVTSAVLTLVAWVAGLGMMGAVS